MKIIEVAPVKEEKYMSSKKHTILFLLTMALMVWLFMMMVSAGMAKAGLISAP